MSGTATLEQKQQQKSKPQQPQPRVSLSEREVTELSDGHQHCLVCYGDLTFRGKLPCGHDDICGACHLRMRHLHDDDKCPICKQSTAEDDAGEGGVIVDRGTDKRHADYPRWGDDIGSGFVHRKDVGMFFQEDYYQTDIIPLFAYACQICDFQVDQTTKSASTQGGSKKNSPQRLLLEHLRSKHRLAMCHLCIDHKRDFISRLPRFSPNQLQNHLRHGDGPKSGFSGHPICVFCKPKRFYDNYHLHQHLHKDHYKCHICEKQGQDNQWFKHYGSLQRHFDQQHYLCHNPQCLEARFVVFENELDLRGHEMSVHGGSSTGSTKINLEFRTLRRGYDGSGMDAGQQAAPDDAAFNYDLDGQAFVPEALSSQSGNEVTRANNGSGNASTSNSNAAHQLHPLHVQRTEELRAHAAAVRRQQAAESQVESFPTLQSTSVAASTSAPLVGWASGGRVNQQSNRGRVGRVTEEAFPVLPATQSNNTNAKKKALKASLGVARRQFAAMNATSNQPNAAASSSSWGGSGPAAYGARPSAASSSYATANGTHSSAAASGNRQIDLAPNNFPVLGPASSTGESRPVSYSSTNALARRNLQGRGPLASTNAAPPSFSSMAEFPSMAIATNAPGVATSTRKQAPQVNQQHTPSLASAADFPPPPSATTSPHAKVRQQILGNDSRPAPQQTADNILQGDLAATAAKATVEDMKASLGQKKFKQLKRLTREFAEGGLSPEGYVDQSAALFDRGYGDPDFWSYLPSLLDSCPNEDASQHALRYMSSLKRQQFSNNSTSPIAAPAPAAPAPTWGGVSTNATVMRPPAGASTTSFHRTTQPPPVRAAPVGFPNTVQSKKKSAWGTGGTPTVVRAKAPPGSVSAAAASQGPQKGTATKFMAKEHKLHQQQKPNNNKKKKQNDELRALAFGR